MGGERGGRNEGRGADMDESDRATWRTADTTSLGHKGACVRSLLERRADQTAAYQATPSAFSLISSSPLPSPSAYSALCRLSLSTGNVTSLDRSLSALPAEDPDKTRRRTQVLRDVADGKYVEAEVELRQLTAQDPDDVEVRKRCQGRFYPAVLNRFVRRRRRTWQSCSSISLVSKRCVHLPRSRFVLTILRSPGDGTPHLASLDASSRRLQFADAPVQPLHALRDQHGTCYGQEGRLIEGCGELWSAGD